MPGGKYFSLTNTVPTKKKKVLSNKALTQKVRTLANTNGQRRHAGHALYDAVTLAAATPQLIYFDDAGVSLFVTGGEVRHHYYTANIQLSCSTAGGSAVRLIYGWDNQPAYGDGDDIIPDDVLEYPTKPTSNYNDIEALPLKEANNKNSGENPRAVIVKDLLIPLIANEKKAFHLKMPLYNKKSSGATAARSQFRPFFVAIADVSTSFDMRVDYYYTTDA